MPILLNAGFIAQHAVAISIVQMIFVSIFGSILNLKKGLLDFKIGIFLGIGGVIGGSLSGMVLAIISPFALSWLFFIFNILAFYKFLTKKPGNTTRPLQGTLAKVFVLILTGAFVGIFAATLGIGGGLFMIPILMRFLGLDTKSIAALSLFFIIFSSSSATFSLYDHQILTRDILQYGLIIGIASIIGVSLGSYFLSKITHKAHRVALIIIYVISLTMMAIHIAKELF